LLHAIEVSSLVVANVGPFLSANLRFVFCAFAGYAHAPRCAALPIWQTLGENTHPAEYSPFRTPTGEALPGNIAELAYFRLGALDQWVMIRGESVATPLFILVHGGPGIPEMRLFRCFNAPLEKSFTVVYWEQRGTGKSFDSKIPKSSMTVEQFIADLDELVDAVRKRLRSCLSGRQTSESLTLAPRS